MFDNIDLSHFCIHCEQGIIILFVLGCFFQDFCIVNGLGRKKLYLLLEGRTGVLMIWETKICLMPKQILWMLIVQCNKNNVFLWSTERGLLLPRIKIWGFPSSGLISCNATHWEHRHLSGPINCSWEPEGNCWKYIEAYAAYRAMKNKVLCFWPCALIFFCQFLPWNFGNWSC